MYRAVAFICGRRGLPLEDAVETGAVADSLDFSFTWDGDSLKVAVNGEDLTLAIRAESVGQGASRVSTHPSVREALLDRQRSLATAGGVVMEGRDIGTVVLPDAELKIFLDASLDARARRRTDELNRRGFAASYDEIREEIRVRDVRDRTREVAPLKQAEGAIYLDTTGLSAEAAADRIVALAHGCV